MFDGWRVALIDSGADPATLGAARATRRFVDAGRRVEIHPVVADALGHGTRVAGVLWSDVARAELLVAQVFDQRRATTAATVAAAIHWAIAEHAALVHLSLGVREDRAVLAGAVAAAAAAGILLIASTPARGPSPFPAAYPGVIRGTGDARCAPDEISALDADRAHFGACARANDGTGGASIGAAHLSRFILRQLVPGEGYDASRRRLAALARFHGPERR
ncbi:MAG: peptidase S8/S53 subtilisin kexin sedolisin [Gammaproteobacteria bacterium]|nr:peptidase S8/S53 subtilisin kexin sedolisin [Gammaproteobacteria bacterium]